ncbi:hypothetical protein [Yimella sp. RIT 621]|uniref:hypothetical protein n=1 Tax=Yimella sp. RIT 621 TaxID=2510323 RepID=UPI00145A00DC|nr:hypothetical protein [Yimella sp. RIT 621]
MSELLPNLEPLAALLGHATPAKADAHALLDAVAAAASVDELDEVIGTIVEGWRTL